MFSCLTKSFNINDKTSSSEILKLCVLKIVRLDTFIKIF